MVMSAAQNATEGHGQCGLRDLCPQDKKKVARLIRQVVELQEEVETQRSYLKDSQEQTDQLQDLRTKNKELVQENAGLRSKLVHALALLRMYQHKVQLLDAAASHQEAARLDENTASQSQLNGKQSRGREYSASEASHAVHKRQGSGSGTQGRSGSETNDTAPLQLYQDTTQHVGGCSGQNQHRHAGKKFCSGHLQRSSQDRESEPDPPAMQVDETCVGGQCSDSHTAAGSPIKAAAQGRDSLATLPASSNISSSAQDPAVAQYVLRFDPTVGECGAFFILRGGETCADSAIASPEGADAAPGPRRSAGHRAEQLLAGEKVDPPPTVLDELEEAPRQVPALPQPYKASRPGTGSSYGQGNGQNNPELLSSGKCCSPTTTESSSCSSRDTSSKRFGGSLMDLVAEVEQLLGQGTDSACYYGSSYNHHSDAASGFPAHAG
ncbi:hypothetical protein COCOBI_03-3240 [Coccomyxa sp. Obi]|nr:hypothetical protein COCOBI_03-3240 [Coccomyxa sp. Obi]